MWLAGTATVASTPELGHGERARLQLLHKFAGTEAAALGVFCTNAFQSACDSFTGSDGVLVRNPLSVLFRYAIEFTYWGIKDTGSRRALALAVTF